MSQFSSKPVRRSGGGDVDVYTGLLFVALVVVVTGVVTMFMVNSSHSAERGGDGGPFKIVQQR